MNSLTLRRRWLIAKPWVKDGFTAILMIVFLAASFWLMDLAAELCTAWEYCA